MIIDANLETLKAILKTTAKVQKDWNDVALVMRYKLDIIS